MTLAATRLQAGSVHNVTVSEQGAAEQRRRAPASSLYPESWILILGDSDTHTAPADRPDLHQIADPPLPNPVRR